MQQNESRSIGWAGPPTRLHRERLAFLRQHYPFPDQRQLVLLAWEAQTIVETSTHKAGEISSTLRAAWSSKIDQADLLVLGYSGADLNFGAAHQFFTDFLDQGRHIYWAHRSGSEPRLPKWIQKRVTLIVGGLPFPLREVRESFGVADFKTPQCNRDAHGNLAEVMDRWSRESHIGPWAAATFFLSLAERSGEKGQPILEKFLQIAREQVGRFEPGSEISGLEAGVAAFFSTAGSIACQKEFIEDAESFHRAAVNVFYSIDKMLAESCDTSKSYQERHMNLATALNQLAHTQIFKNDMDISLSSFTRSLHESYLADFPSTFLPTLFSILNYGFEVNNIYRCMQIAESALRLADRFGIVQSSIGFRILLAGYAHKRNELWIASEWLCEASCRALALNDQRAAQIVELMLGENRIRSGRIKEGLTRIATAVEKLGRSAIRIRSIEDLRRLLVALGIKQPLLYQIVLASHSIAGHVSAIEEVRKIACDRRDILWNGAHCRISESATIDQNTKRALFQLGLYEFDGKSDLATHFGLKLAKELLSRGEHFEARWAARNVLLRPGVKTLERARAHSAIAEAAASLGFLDEARTHLDAAADDYLKAGIGLTPSLTWIGLWFHVQCKDLEEAIIWAKHRVISCWPAMASELWVDVVRLESLGTPISQAASVIRDYLECLNQNISSESTLDSSRRFMAFSGHTQQQMSSDEEVSQMLHQAQLAIQQGDLQYALSVLDSLSEQKVIPEHQAGAIIALQIHAMALLFPLEKLKAFAKYQRERLVRELKFTALSRVESSIKWALLKHHQDNQREVEELGSRSWIGDLAADPIARSNLLACEAFHPLMTGKSIVSDSRTCKALRAARYFYLPEAVFTRLDAGLTEGTEGQADETHTDKITSATKQALNKAFSKSIRSDQADQALAEAVKSLRNARALDRVDLARMRGDRANWALRNYRYLEAVGIFRKVQRSFRLLGRIDDALNAMAGEARSLSRSGQYEEAIDVFRKAIQEATNHSILTNLLLGLGSAHLLEGTKRRFPPDQDLIHQAVDSLRQAVQSAPGISVDRSMAKLALARSLGENSEQQAALDLFDKAVAELAHLGDSRAKLLMEHRYQLKEGIWCILALV